MDANTLIHRLPWDEAFLSSRTPDTGDTAITFKDDRGYRVCPINAAGGDWQAMDGCLGLPQYERTLLIEAADYTVNHLYEQLGAAHDTGDRMFLSDALRLRLLMRLHMTLQDERPLLPGLFFFAEYHQ
jgi:hypothetical protein